MDSTRLEITVKLFAALAEEAGTRQVTVEVAGGATVGDVLDALEEQLPFLTRWRRRLAVAINYEYSPEDAPVADGDELALIPPVSGGGGGPCGVGGGGGGAGEIGDAGKTRPAAKGGEGGGANKGAPILLDGGRFKVTFEPLSADAAAAHVVDPEKGAVVVFTGVVRKYTGDHVTDHLVYEAYGPMAAAEMARLGARIEEQWPDARVAMHHRVGRLEIGEASVVIAVATPHRGHAFEAARFGIDALKERVPVWKKEVYADGSHWVGGDGRHPGD